MNTSTILILGGDKRNTFLAEMLKSHGHNIRCFLVPEYAAAPSLELLKKLITGVQYIICPTPCSRDKVNITTSAEYADTQLSLEITASLISSSQTVVGGYLPDSFCRTLTKRDIPYYDLKNFESFKFANSYLSAEGMLKDIIEFTPFSLRHAKILILGYGGFGKAVADILSHLNADITVYNRNKSYEGICSFNGIHHINKLSPDESLSSYNIIINTVPAEIFTEKHLKFVSKSAYLFETAGSSGGFNTEYIRKNNLNYRNLPGIPGKTAPMSAAHAIFHIICEELN